MSLVGDALRRARRDAGSRYGLPHARIPGDRRPGRLPVWAVVALVAAAALAGAASVYFLLTPSSTSPSAAARLQATPVSATAETRRSMPIAANSTGVEVAAPPPAEALASAVAPTPATVSSGDASTGPSSAAPPSQPTPNAVAVPGRTAVAPPAETAATPSSETTKTRVFLIDADLGYAKLHLDFLVYRPSAPFGRVNGTNVVVGSTINGFTVESIGPDAITLRDRHGTIVLKTR